MRAHPPEVTVRSIIELAHGLEKETIAERVEDAPTLHLQLDEQDLIARSPELIEVAFAPQPARSLAGFS